VLYRARLADCHSGGQPSRRRSTAAATCAASRAFPVRPARPRCQARAAGLARPVAV